MNEVVDGVQKLLLLSLQHGVVGGDFDQLLFQLADDGRLPQYQSLKLLLLLLEYLQLHLPLLVHVFHPFLQNAKEEEEKKTSLAPRFILTLNCCGQQWGTYMFLSFSLLISLVWTISCFSNLLVDREFSSSRRSSRVVWWITYKAQREEVPALCASDLPCEIFHSVSLNFKYCPIWCRCVIFFFFKSELDRLPRDSLCEMAVDSWKHDFQQLKQSKSKMWKKCVT